MLTKKQEGISMKFYIKEFRHKRNLSIRKLSRVSKVSKTTISDAENGKIIPCLINMCKIARALEVKVTELFEMEESDFE